MASYYELHYTLTEDEIFRGLKTSGIYKTSGKRAVIETVILIVLCSFFLISFIMKQEMFDLVMALVSAIVTALLNIVPRMDMRKQARKGEKEIRLRIYPDKLYVYGARETTQIELDGSSTIHYAKKEEIISVALKGGAVLIIPIRAIPQENCTTVKQILMAE